MGTLYRKLQNDIKAQIIAGIYKEDDLLPSENELQQIFGVTRATVRHALSELVSEGYIRKQQGKGSIVTRPQRRTLGLLSIRGFSEVLSNNRLAVHTEMIHKPTTMPWARPFFYPINDLQEKAGCIYLQRIRFVGEDPVILETTHIPNLNLPRFCSLPFINGSLFETLNSRYMIEITRVDQDLRAVEAIPEVAKHLKIKSGTPLLLIYLRFHTSRAHLSIFSSLLCTTDKYSIGNNI